jgi:hypothetical protein
MSYDIYLYDRQFLKRALDEDLDDWSDAAPISKARLDLIRARLQAKGYIDQDNDEYAHPNEKWGTQVCIYSGEIAFDIPYWNDADAAIEAASADALELAQLAELGYYDPQIDEVITSPDD